MDFSVGGWRGVSVWHVMLRWNTCLSSPAAHMLTAVQFILVLSAELKFILSCCYLFFAVLSVSKTFFLSRNLVRDLASVKQLTEWYLHCYFGHTEASRQLLYPVLSCILVLFIYCLQFLKNHVMLYCFEHKHLGLLSTSFEFVAQC